MHPSSPAPAAQSAPLPEAADVVVVGAGAAGLFAATWAGRTAAAAGRPLAVVAVDGARKLGAKILVAGGGRCNVTHDAVHEGDYAGSTPPAIRKVLRRFGVADTVQFFAAAGVAMKREETGKLFPVTDSARTILEALVAAARAAGVTIVHPARVTEIMPTAGEFVTVTNAGTIRSRAVILCTGGKSLPKSGSDGGGLLLATALGHTLTSPVVPALVPLVLPTEHWITALSGLTLPTEIVLASATGRRLWATTGSTLCTHVGLSGPAVLDISRHWLVARTAEPDVRLSLNWLPGTTAEATDRWLVAEQGRGALATLRDRLPDRLARSLCELATAPPTGDLPRDARRRLVALATATPLPLVGDRGFAVAEATAGGVPLAEVRLETMESRICPGLSFAGEVLDVDGRIGGFNFQWAWASGFVAGTAAAERLTTA
ncbi:MAG: aminoacetone oxidase family FAD-binding enzyme [Planctomycetaceae bacterium]|jgi:predicted Rossmann fold flavoprotein|nr:aminoacetone oxidase family FAD-binding enzyme [Planctomycetaceae bacterium]